MGTENAELSIDLFQGDPGANNNVAGAKGEKGNLASQVSKLFYFCGERICTMANFYWLSSDQGGFCLSATQKALGNA